MTEEKNSEMEIDLDREIDEALEGADKEAVSEKEEPVEEDQDPTVMGRLLKDNPVKLPKEGDKLTGKVVGKENLAIYVDLGILGTGVVYGKEIKDGFGEGRKKLGVGDEITATVVDLENEDGYVELSISEAVREQAWNDLREKRDERTVINTKILDANKGGLIVEVNDMVGFMPVSQLTPEHYPRVEDGDKNKILEILKSYIGTEMSVCVLDVNEEEEKLIVSEKVAFRDREKEAIKELKKGDIIEGEVSGVVDFGAFVKFLPPSCQGSDKEEDKLEGLVHISQLDWQLIDDPRKVVKAGEKVQAKIIAIDDTRISLSIRELKNDPWMSVGERYKVGDIVKGTVNKVNHFGAFVYLDQDIHGLSHISSFPGFPMKAIDEIVRMGGEYYWEIMSLEPKEHRMGLKFVGEKAPKKLQKDAEKEDAEKKDTGEEIVEKKKADQSKGEEKVAGKKDTEKKEEKEEKVKDNSSKKESDKEDKKEKSEKVATKKEEKEEDKKEERKKAKEEAPKTAKKAKAKTSKQDKESSDAKADKKSAKAEKKTAKTKANQKEEAKEAKK